VRWVGVVAAALLLAPAALGAAPTAHVYRIARVVDGDTVDQINQPCARCRFGELSAYP